MDLDDNHVAHCLLYLAGRNALLEELRHHVEMFVKFGMSSGEHAKLIRLLQRIEAHDRHESPEKERESDLWDESEG